MNTQLIAKGTVRNSALSAEAAHRFADLIKPVDDDHPRATAKHQLTGHRGGEQQRRRLPDR